MFKTLSQRLEDYIVKHPYFDIDTVYSKVLENHKKAIWKLQHRISDRVQHMIENQSNVYFLTFTFNDKNLPLNDTQKIKSGNTLHDFMMNNGVSMYVANIDYGKENGRFHWHAVALSENPFSHEFWKMGAVNFKKVPKSSIPLKLTRYLIKLKRHATKITDPIAIYYPMHYKKVLK
jgi:hypothetical protein